MANPARPVAAAKSNAAIPAAARRLVSRLSELVRGVTVGCVIVVFFFFAFFVAVGVTLEPGVLVAVAERLAVGEADAESVAVVDGLVVGVRLTLGVGLAARALGLAPAANRNTIAETRPT